MCILSSDNVIRCMKLRTNSLTVIKIRSLSNAVDTPAKIDDSTTLYCVRLFNTC